VWLIAGCTLLLATALALLVNPHSIVSSTCKYLKTHGFLAKCAKFTVRLTAKTIRLRAIDGDKWRQTPFGS
jgi:hypothetical protein